MIKNNESIDNNAMKITRIKYEHGTHYGFKVKDLKDKVDLILLMCAHRNTDHNKLFHLYENLIKIRELKDKYSGDEFKQKIDEEGLLDVCIEYYLEPKKPFAELEYTIDCVLNGLCWNVNCFDENDIWQEDGYKEVLAFKKTCIEASKLKENQDFIL